jgi:hypothetical protein
MSQLSDHGKGRHQPPDWDSGLDMGTLQLIGSKLDRPDVPGVVHLSSVCRSWRAAARQTPGLAITWCIHDMSKQHFLAWGIHREQVFEKSMQPWLLTMASQLDTLRMQSTNPGGHYEHVVCAALAEAARKAAAAGKPLPLRRLQLPLRLGGWYRTWSLQQAPLPHLRCLSLYLGGQPFRQAQLLAALGDIHHITSLEVGLQRPSSSEPRAPPWAPLEEVLGVAPKQLQHLALRVDSVEGPGGAQSDRPRRISYSWAPLAAFPHLKQLQLGAVRVKDLAPLASLPSLTSLGLQCKGKDWQPLVAVKGVLRELEVGTVTAAVVPHLEQLTCLTSLSVKNGTGLSSLPQQVASGLQHLDWGLVEGPDRRGTTTTSSSSSSGGGGSDKDPVTQRLQHCSSSNLQDLQLRGSAWLQDRGAAEVVQRQTALTSFGLHAVMVRGAPETALSPWRALLPMAHLQQLRRLVLPCPLLATPGTWLGGLPHLTSLRLAVAWPAPWDKDYAFGNRTSSRQVVSNLRSCWSGLKVLEVDLTLTYSKGYIVPSSGELVPGVRSLLRRELPGVHLLLSCKQQAPPGASSDFADASSDSADASSDSAGASSDSEVDEAEEEWEEWE